MSKLVKKHWGQELWIEDGSECPYALKRILFKEGNRTSLQVHKFKTETNHVISGTGKLVYSTELFDIDNFVNNGMTTEEIEVYESSLETLYLEPGVSFTMRPGQVHRVIATTDLEFVEASTCHLDDVFRLQDDAGRVHGKIDSEHT